MHHGAIYAAGNSLGLLQSAGLQQPPGAYGLAAAAVVAFAAAAQVVAVAVAAAAEQKDQDNDPPAAVTAPRTVVTHNDYLRDEFVTAFAVHSMLFPRQKKVRRCRKATRYPGSACGGNFRKNIPRETL